MFAARRFGAEQAVLASLDKTFPHMGWTAELPDYLVSRVAEHGRRRAAEMREVAATLEDVGIRAAHGRRDGACGRMRWCSRWPTPAFRTPPANSPGARSPTRWPPAARSRQSR